MNIDITAAHARLADYAEDNDADFSPSDADLCPGEVEALVAHSLLAVGEDGIVDEVAPFDRTKIRRTHSDLDELTVLVDENPKRAGTKTHSRFGWYSESPTVGDFVRRCEAEGISRRVALNDIRWDVEHGHIAVGDLEDPQEA